MAFAPLTLADLRAHLATPQLANVAELQAQGWKAYKAVGRVNEMAVLLSRPVNTRSNVASGKDYLRVHPGCQVTPFTPGR